MLIIIVRRICDGCRSDDLRWHDIYTKFHDDRLRNSSNDLNNLRGYGVDITDEIDL
jgi:hypothetical protein